ncbi:MAG TPA: APC family permease [Acidimicrobiales bacterium]|jgi:amino acid transporter|nr:APC family permease [Acidimicrobiales bacterium]
MPTSAGTTDAPAMNKPEGGLRTNVLGLPSLFAQSVALISPTMTAVLIIPLAFASAGQGTWLAYAFGTIMLLFVVFCLNQFAKRSAFAGSMYAYTGKGLGPSAGVFSGWTLIWSYFFIAVAGMCGFAVFCQQLLSALGYHGSVHPIIFFAISAAACWVIAYKDIRVSTLLTLVLECVSVVCITALAFVILFKHGFHVDTNELSLSGVNVRGMGLAVVACIFSLVGFEAATTMGSEAKNPRKNLPRAVIASLVITGLFMVFMAYVEVSGTSNYGAGWTSAPLNFLAQAYGVSWFRIPVSIGAMVSFFSLSLSCLNSGARIIYPMARHGIFSGHLGRAHATNRTPHVAVTLYIGMIFALPAFLMIFTNPLTAFGDAGTLAAFGFLVAYYLITVAAPVYLKKIGELSPRNVVLACVAVLCLLVPTVGSFYPMPLWPVDLFPYIYLAWMAVGGTWLFIVNRRRPGILAAIEADLERAPEPLEDEIVVPELSIEPAMA